MEKIYKEVLSQQQISLFDLLKKLRNKFYMAGGTALALQLGHRQSIDFDLFSRVEFKNDELYDKLDENKIESVLIDQKDELTLIYSGVKVTFLYYPFKGIQTKDWEVIKLANELTIAAMKAYALGRRSKWKDYVDLYFTLQDYKINEIVELAESMFRKKFSEKLFREQLAYFEDIDHSEKVNYVIDNPPVDTDIKDKLMEIASTI